MTTSTLSLIWKKHSTACSIFFLMALTTFVYAPTFHNKFQILWDDWWVVINTYTEGGINFENIINIFTNFYHGQYAPVNELYYLFLYNLFNYNPFWFHFTSLLVHLFNVALVFLFLKRLLKLGGAFPISSIFLISFITAILVGIHPFLVEAVAWMAASKCILFTFFYLLALHTYLQYISSQKWRYYFLTILFFIISFGSKEQAVTLPACLILLDYVLKRELRDLKVWMEKIPYFILSTTFIIITFYSQQQNSQGILSEQVSYAWYQDILFSAYTVTEYFIKCIIPIRLSFLYPFPILPGEQLPLIFWVYPITIISLVVGFWKSLTKKWIFFGIGFFIIQVSVYSNIIPTSRFSIIADRYVNLASIGVFFLIAYLIDNLLNRNIFYRRTIIGCLILYIVCLATYANERCQIWHDSKTLKQEIRETLKERKDYNFWKSKYNLAD